LVNNGVPLRWSASPGTAPVRRSAAAAPARVPVTTACTSAWRSAYASSGGLPKGLSSAECAPIRLSARNVSTQSALFSSTMATRVFFPMPSARNRRASSADRASASP
jgi:hypothetical protein